ELRANLERLAQVNVHPILLKGVGVAYRCYPLPYLRPHLDTDLLVHKSDTAAIRKVMEAAGYRRPVAIEGDRIQHQFYYDRAWPEGVFHAYDFHWRVANPEIFADLIPIEAAEQCAVQVAALGSGARTLGDAHALLLACVHRVAHHRDAANLLWLYDIH